MSDRTRLAANLLALLPLLAAAGAPSPAPLAQEIRLPAAAGDSAPRRGAKTFTRYCATCHGVEGKGDGPGALDLDPRPRDLTLRRFRFRTTPSGAAPRPEDIERTIREGLPGSAMPGFDDLFSAGEIDELVAFIDALQREPGEISRIEPVSIPTPGAASPASIEEGQALYLFLGCWRCHGIGGGGNGPSAATLTDEDDRPIRSTNLRRDAFKGGREAGDVVRALLTGLNGTPMPAYGDTVILAREDADTSAFAELVDREVLSQVERWLASSPTRAELERLDEGSRSALRDRRLAALAHFVLSLDRRRGLAFRLFGQRPELESRAP